MGGLSVIVNLSCLARNEVLCYLSLFFLLFALCSPSVSMFPSDFPLYLLLQTFSKTAFGRTPRLISLASGLQSSVLSARALGNTGSYARAFQNESRLSAQSKSELPFSPPILYTSLCWATFVDLANVLKLRNACLYI